eukprot:CAMPEP_0114264014 /NCGR_PEP_ID=MMETSP0058-20121206/22913_1 /TAXON_ID=36894 /ORGANISM="Pyramimonas parkeae, CCMP726" /LENGTH=230 /DNA_ID=CAMNT_0001380525 /DNA_START=123 /DNA_END=812 /DNA_ORIENTATION=+
MTTGRYATTKSQHPKRQVPSHRGSSTSAFQGPRLSYGLDSVLQAYHVPHHGSENQTNVPSSSAGAKILVEPRIDRPHSAGPHNGSVRYTTDDLTDNIAAVRATYSASLQSPPPGQATTYPYCPRQTCSSSSDSSSRLAIHMARSPPQDRAGSLPEVHVDRPESAFSHEQDDKPDRRVVHSRANMELNPRPRSSSVSLAMQHRRSIEQAELIYTQAMSSPPAPAPSHLRRT